MLESWIIHLALLYLYSLSANILELLFRNTGYSTGLHPGTGKVGLRKIAVKFGPRREILRNTKCYRPCFSKFLIWNRIQKLPWSIETYSA